MNAINLIKTLRETKDRIILTEGWWIYHCNALIKQQKDLPETHESNYVDFTSNELWIVTYCKGDDFVAEPIEEQDLQTWLDDNDFNDN